MGTFLKLETGGLSRDRIRGEHVADCRQQSPNLGLLAAHIDGSIIACQVRNTLDAFRRPWTVHIFFPTFVNRRSPFGLI